MKECNTYCGEALQVCKLSEWLSLLNWSATRWTLSNRFHWAWRRSQCDILSRKCFGNCLRALSTQILRSFKQNWAPSHNTRVNQEWFTMFHTSFHRHNGSRIPQKQIWKIFISGPLWRASFEVKIDTLKKAIARDVSQNTGRSNSGNARFVFWPSQCHNQAKCGHIEPKWMDSEF